MKRFFLMVGVVLLALCPIFVAGCSGGSGGNAGGSGSIAIVGGGAGAVAGSATVNGLASLGSESLEGARIAVVVGDQELPLAQPAVVGHGGAVVANLLTLVPSGRFQVRITNAQGEVFSTDVDALSSNTFVHTNALSTLCAAYHQQNPSLSTAEARERVQAFVHVTDRGRIGDEVANLKFSRFSQQVFLQKARAYPGGLAAYTQRVAQAVDTPLAAGTGEYDANDTAPSFDSNVQPLMDAVADKVTSPPNVSSPTVEEAFPAEGKGTNFVDPVVGVVMGLIQGGIKIYSITQLTTALGQIQTALQEVGAALVTLAGQISYLTKQQEYYTLVTGITQTNIPRINTTAENLQNVSHDAAIQDLTDLGEALASLYGTAQSPVTVATNYNDAVAIYQSQFSSDGVTESALHLGWTLCNLNAYINSGSGSFQNLVPFLSAANYYMGYQIQAGSNIAALASPYDFGPYPGQTPTFGTAAGSSPAGATNDATNRTAWTQSATVAIPDMVQQQLSMLPLPLLSDSTLYDITHKNLWYCTNSASSPSTSIPWVKNLNAGGISNWSIASEPAVQQLYAMVAALPGNSSKPSSYSALLNAIGFNKLTPGPVVAGSIVSQNPYTNDWDPIDDLPWTFTKTGFLCINVGSKYSESGYNGFDVYFVSDSGSSGYIGSCCTPGQTYNDLLNALNSSKSVWMTHATGLGNGKTPFYGGKLTGPMLVVFNSGTFASQETSFAFVTLGCYKGITIAAQPAVADPLSNQSSFTQQLVATADGSAYGVTYGSQYPITNEVYWTSNNNACTYAPISNVVPAPSSTPPPSGYVFTPLPNGAGTIHWLPASAGQTVTFQASRYDVTGTRVTGTIQLKSPVPSPVPSATPDAVTVWPSSYTIASTDLMATGLKLWFSRHWGSGRFDDVTNSADITVTSSNPSVTYNPASGQVTSAAPIASGTTVTLTITDTKVPAQADVSTRNSVTCTLYVK